MILEAVNSLTPPPLPTFTQSPSSLKTLYCIKTSSELYAVPMNICTRVNGAVQINLCSLSEAN